MTLVVKSDNEINSTKAKLSHSKKHNNKSKLAASSSSTKNLVNIQPKPSPPFLLPCQPPFIYPSSNSAAVVAQQQLFSLQLLMSSPYFAQALASLNTNNANGNNTNGNTANVNTANINNIKAATNTTNATVNTVKANGNAIPSTIANSIGSPSTTNTSNTNNSSNSKIATSAPNSVPPNTLPFLPPNISLPYLAAAMTSLANANQQILNNNKTNTKINNTSATNLSTSAPSSNNKNIKVSPKGTKINPAPSGNPSLFPKTDNAAAANAALLLNNSLLTNQFLQFLQQQQQQQPNKPLMVNPFTVPTTSSNAIPIAANTNSKSNPINISSSFPSVKAKSKISSSSLLINKSKNSKLSTSPNIKSKIKLPIKKDPMSISKNHRRTSISQSYDPKNPMVNSLFNMVNNNNNTNKLSSSVHNTTSFIKTENENVAKDQGMNKEGLESTSPTMATSPLLPISIPFSNLNIRSNPGSSPTMESNVLSAPNLSTLCTVASQEAKLLIPSKSSEEKKNSFTTLPSAIKEEETETNKETNIFTKLDTSNRNAPTSLLTKNIQNQKMMDDEKKMNEIEQANNKENAMDEDKKPEMLNNSNAMSIPLPIPMPMPPMSLPTITINSGENALDKKPLQHSFNPSTTTNLMSSSPQSPSALSSTSSSSSTSPKLYNNGFHSVPHTALQRRKSRSMSCSKDYVCELCKPNKRFVQLAHLRIHQRKHTGERPFVCSYCNKSFAQQGNLKTHQRKHTGERPFTCPICFKTFTQSGNLKQHELVHQGVRPFVCEWCDKTFTQSGNLKTHQIKMHPELMQHAEDGSIIRSPISSTGGRSRRHSHPQTHTTTHVEEDHMMVDHSVDNASIPETEEEDSHMMIDDEPSINNTTDVPVQDQKFSSAYDGQVFGMDNDDYDEIQPMESGVIRPNMSNNEDYDDGYYINGQFKEENDVEDGEERNFDEEGEEKSSKYSNTVFEYEGSTNDGYNQPENNIKERQLLKRLKALLKRN